MKKLFAILLTLALLCGVISGCAEIHVDIEKPIESSVPADEQTEIGETEAVVEENDAAEPTVSVEDATEAATESTATNNPSDDEDEGNNTEIPFDLLLG